MKKYLIFFILLIFFSVQINAQKISFLVLGDLHYDLLDDHDMDWLGTKPDDLRQVTKEYTFLQRKTGAILRKFCKKK